MNFLRLIKNIYRLYKNIILFKKATILTPYIIGKNTIGVKSILNEGVVFENSQLGDGSYVNRNTIIKNSNIGKYCSISFNCVIGAENHNLRNLSTSPIFDMNKRGSIITTISDDVWIGANVVIKAGVKIGKGSVIGAGSIVTKDVEPFSISAGIPARAIKSRLDYFNSEDSEVLQSLNYDLKLQDLLELQKNMNEKLN